MIDSVEPPSRIVASPSTIGGTSAEIVITAKAPAHTVAITLLM
jgi:hypothetical protein